MKGESHLKPVRLPELKPPPFDDDRLIDRHSRFVRSRHLNRFACGRVFDGQQAPLASFDPIMSRCITRLFRCDRFAGASRIEIHINSANQNSTLFRKQDGSLRDGRARTKSTSTTCMPPSSTCSASTCRFAARRRLAP
jgi:hypothetical protein